MASNSASTNRHFDLDLRSHLLRWVLLAASILGRSTILWRLIGALNRRVLNINALFFCYAGSTQYARRYCYRWSERWVHSTPSPIGIYRQGQSWGIAFASPITEEQLLDSANTALCEILTRLERISHLTRVEHVKLAGIIPSHLRRIGHSLDAGAAMSSVGRVVVRAIDETIQASSLPHPATVVLLGGQGLIGSQVTEQLERASVPYVVVDPKGPDAAIPANLLHAPILLVDLSRAGALDHHIDSIPQCSIVLNEVFPEPSRETVTALKRKDCRVLHIAGVKGRFYPSLPGNYADSVPCCAMQNDSDFDVVIREI